MAVFSMIYGKMAKWVNFFSVLFEFHIKGELESGNRHEWGMVLVSLHFRHFDTWY
jgi:hypothetical protein